MVEHKCNMEETLAHLTTSVVVAHNDWLVAHIPITFKHQELQLPDEHLQSCQLCKESKDFNF